MVLYINRKPRLSSSFGPCRNECIPKLTQGWELGGVRVDWRGPLPRCLAQESLHPHPPLQNKLGRKDLVESQRKRGSRGPFNTVARLVIDSPKGGGALGSGCLPRLFLGFSSTSATSSSSPPSATVGSSAAALLARLARFGLASPPSATVGSSAAALLALLALFGLASSSAYSCNQNTSS